MIGVYDSGVGGLSVWKELISLMPEKGYIYVADTAHCPYGEKPIDYIIERADKVSSFLISQGAKMVVVACNTATAAAINFLRTKYPIPFVGMEPAVKPAAIISKSGVVGVLATANTFKGRLYRDTVMKYCSKTKVIEVVGKGLV
jgi:glutamate racemase